MGGYEVCRQLKNNSTTRNIPVIFVTAKNEVEDETLVLELGAVDYMTKPINPLILLVRIKTQSVVKQVQDFLRNQNQFLETEVQKSTLEVQTIQEAHNEQSINYRLPVGPRVFLRDQ